MTLGGIDDSDSRRKSQRFSRLFYSFEVNLPHCIFLDVKSIAFALSCWQVRNPLKLCAVDSRTGSEGSLNKARKIMTKQFNGRLLYD